jgi:hypothetical protein
VRRIVAACSKDRHDFVTVPAEESARQLLGARFNDSCSESCTVEDFDPRRLALPSLGGVPVDLNGVLDNEAREALRNFETRLLEDPEVVAERLRDGSVPRDSYFDKVMRTDRGEYLKLLQMCSVSGLLRGVRRRRGRCTPFCVKKKGGAQRLVLDCRLVNAHFKASPFTEIAAAEALAPVETEADQPTYLASADIKACFYQCGIDEALSEWFCLPSVSGVEARVLGICAYEDGVPLPAGAAPVHLALAVLPMGFSWAFWFVQSSRDPQTNGDSDREGRPVPLAIS